MGIGSGSGVGCGMSGSGFGQGEESHRDQIQAAAPDQLSAWVADAESAAFLAALYSEKAAILNLALLAYFRY